MLFQSLLLMLFSVNLSQAPSPSKGVLSGLATTAMGAVNKVVFDKVDLKSIFNPVFEEVQKKLGSSSCIAGVYIDDKYSVRTLKLVNGKISDLNLMSTNTNALKDDANTITATVTFSFPNLPIKYDFDFTTQRLVATVERKGYAKVKQEGPVTVQFVVQLPKSQKKVDEMKHNKKCVAIIKSVKTSVNDKLTTVTVDYNSWAHSIGLKVTEDSIKEMLVGLHEDLKDNIEAAVKVLIEPVFRGNAFNCNEASYTVPIGASALKAIDCKHVVTATKYKRHS